MGRLVLAPSDTRPAYLGLSSVAVGKHRLRSHDLHLTRALYWTAVELLSKLLQSKYDARC